MGDTFAESLSLPWPESIAAEALPLGRGLLKQASTESGRSQVCTLAFQGLKEH